MRRTGWYTPSIREVNNYRDVDLGAMPSSVLSVIDKILEREGEAFTDHPNDHPTKWGIRKLSADRAGYTGSIRAISRPVAMKIWIMLFWYRPRLYLVYEISAMIADTVIDTSGPAGLKVGITHLQKALTSFNLQRDGRGIYGEDLVLDGLIGAKTLAQLRAYLTHRNGSNGERKLAARLNCLQDAHYTELAVRRPDKRDFSFGWTSQRVYADLVALADETATVMA